MKNHIHFLKGEEGATTLEYGLMAAAITGVIITIIIAIVATFNTKFLT
ncbi:MAG: Flp family type IVb pilin [Candidatus Brocadia sp. WS118]|nr:MAG: Flp family type IVb pilin [Candidatus Brocadia sp. WS118]